MLARLVLTLMVLLVTVVPRTRQELDVKVVSEAPAWSSWAGDLGGTRFSVLSEVNGSNVHRLRVAWKARVGDETWPATEGSESRRLRFEVTPVFLKGALFLSTPHGHVLALDPSDGSIKWRLDTGVDVARRYAEDLTSRGVAVWSRPTPTGAPCDDRVFVATVAAELFAIDAKSGGPCTGFGDEGKVDLREGVALGAGGVNLADYSVTSPPTVVGDLVVVGSAVRTTGQGGAASGLVRAYDAVSGLLRWAFDPLPRSPSHAAARHWEGGTAGHTAGGNVWGGISADPKGEVLFLPTASAGPDSYGGLRRGRNDFANSVVALDVKTGAVLWSFQVVHHDLWDYDVAAQPVLGDFRRDGRNPAAVFVGSKSGSLFVLDRRTGEPLIPVEDVPVPGSDVPGEVTWPTQPFPVWPTLQGRRLSPDSAFGVTKADREVCRNELNRLRNEGTFTPPSLGGSVVWPGFWGGINWDGLAWDPERRILMVTMKRLATVVEVYELYGPSSPGTEHPRFGSRRVPLVAPSGIPCTPPPWSLVIALRPDEREILWTAPLGTVPSLSELPGAGRWGSLSFGGPLVTGGGLVFIAASQDDRIRALDTETGRELWGADLPAGGQSAPMTYLHEGDQYVVIAAGGRGGIGSAGDWVVAYRLP